MSYLFSMKIKNSDLWFLLRLGLYFFFSVKKLPANLYFNTCTTELKEI